MAESVANIGTIGLPALAAPANDRSAHEADFEGWYKDASATVLNLATPDGELIRFFSEQYATASPAKQAALQQLADMRSRSAAALTQLIRLIGETARQIISNIR